MKNHAEKYDENTRIEKLRKMVDNKDYLDDAIHRIAQVLSNEIIGNQEGANYEQQRKRWKTPLL